MDPISLAIGAVGLGMQVFGGFGAAKASKAQAQASADFAKVQSHYSQDEALQEQGINDQKQHQMELEASRMQLENVRNNQRARAMATNASVSQGATLGSGIQGGLDQIQGQSGFNMVGTNNALEIGHNINAYNQKITADKYLMADAQSQYAQTTANNQSNMADSQALSSLGGSLMKAGPIVGQFSKGFGGFSNLFSGSGGGTGLSLTNTGGLY